MNNSSFLYQQWQVLFKQLSNDEALCKKAYEKVIDAYSESNRHYHTLAHIRAMLEKALELGYSVENTSTLFWSIWLHDVVYSTFSNANEEKSAEYAIQLLMRLDASSEVIEKVSTYIKATAHHTDRPEDNELNLFLDLDLMILGQPQEVYQDYTQKIRREYSLIPNLLYKTGRRKMLKEFLESERIYHTAAFTKYEAQARENLFCELQQLS